MEAILAHSSSDPEEMLRAATLLFKRAFTEKGDILMEEIKKQRLEIQNRDIDTARLKDEVETLKRQLDSRVSIFSQTQRPPPIPNNALRTIPFFGSMPR